MMAYARLVIKEDIPQTFLHTSNSPNKKKKWKKFIKEEKIFPLKE